MKPITMSRYEAEDGACPTHNYQKSDAPTGIVTFGYVLGDKQNSSMTIKEGIFSIPC